MYLRGAVGLSCEEATARESRHSRNLRFNEISIYYLHEQVNFTRFQLHFVNAKYEINRQNIVQKRRDRKIRKNKETRKDDKSYGVLRCRVQNNFKMRKR